MRGGERQFLFLLTAARNPTSYRHVSASIGDDETGGSDVCDLGKARVQHYDQSGGKNREREKEREVERKGIFVCGHMLDFGRRTRRPDPNLFGQRLLIYLTKENQ